MRPTDKELDLHRPDSTRKAPGMGIPATRGDCTHARPCPYVTCTHHLLRETGDTCTLDVADDGGVTHDRIAAILGCTTQRVQQIESRALVKLRTNRVARHWSDNAPLLRVPPLPEPKPEAPVRVTIAEARKAMRRGLP